MPWVVGHFPVTPLERSRSRGGRYACAGAAAELACLAEALKLVFA